ncbi:MAG: molybdopterin molybdenumtransferase MoeA [Rhodospirillaceae bacterium]|nr:molybdopterin molybdenumtransferase MoeA [Rhodospirillaceae bacterium]|tara:strand:+ start:3469 stop:4740 length:1272 start_codon:yes stop_codon:yes gene_type:complete
MAQLNDDCFAFGNALKPATEALSHIETTVKPITEIEYVPLSMATARVLAKPVISEINVPPHDNAAVDGYAVYFEDLNPSKETRLKLSGESSAGHPYYDTMNHGTTIQVFTGAALIQNEQGEVADTIFMQEDCRLEGDEVIFPPGINRGANKRKTGEDIKVGDKILSPGVRLRPQDIGIAAAAGLTKLPVFKKLRVAIFSTGDEIYDPGKILPKGAIYDSNRYTIYHLLENLGCIPTDLGIIKDNEEVLRDAFHSAIQTNDVILTSGGMSTGREDHVKSVVEALGKIHFWRLAIRPGRPIAIGQISQVPFIGLPGNPVAVLVTFLLFARPLLLRLGGCNETKPNKYPVKVSFDYKKKKGRREWMRVKLAINSSNELNLVKYRRDGAGILSSTVFADGLMEIEEGITDLKVGDLASFIPFNEILR